MRSEPSWNEIIETPPGVPESGHPAEHSSGVGQRRSRRGVGCLAVILVFLALLGGGTFAVWTAFEEPIRRVLGWQEPVDFTGSGSGEVTITVTDGDVGGDVAQTLVDAGVTKTYEAFYSLLLTRPDVSFQAGSYRLALGMSAEAALTALQDPANRAELTVLLQEGKSITQALELVSAGTGKPLAELTAAASDLPSFGIPAEAPSLEGYLFPATYAFDPSLDAHGILQTMVDRTFQSLDAAGVAPADRHRVLTLAALIQREAGPVSEDFFKVSRVFQNRLDTPGWKLESDATVSYGTGRLDTVWTTGEERADASNPYNTYANPGLPVGPIGAAGDLAIDAALHPVDGPWFFFVPINLETGETVFSATLAEHNVAVKKLQSWCRETGSALCD